MCKRFLVGAGRVIADTFFWFESLFGSPKFFRRSILIACLVYLGIIIWRVMVPEILLHIQGPGASIVLGVIGMLASIIAFYQWLRTQDEKWKQWLLSVDKDFQEWMRLKEEQANDRLN